MSDKLWNDATVRDTLAASPTTTNVGGASIPYPFPSPADWRDQWIYFLLVDRFSSVSGPPVGGFPCDTYQGGTFDGIKARLPYLRDLGVGAIWVSPVLMNPQWFHLYWGGYGSSDLLRIEPRYCADPARARNDPDYADSQFRTLVDAIHAHGMYVILDIVLNHLGDLFDYGALGDQADYKPTGEEYPIRWRDSTGTPRSDWPDIAGVQNLPRDTGVWPSELQRNDFFRRRGGAGQDGDFARMRELVTEYQTPDTGRFPVRDILIRAHQYLIARFDLDGFRIDTLKYVKREFARVFGNAMREYALSIGKKNFFTFGEVWDNDDEAAIARYVGRHTDDDGQSVGVDAALDFPVFHRLNEVIRNGAPPSAFAEHDQRRREALRRVMSSHGEASRYYVTFLDNHDLDARFHDPQHPARTPLALTCLMTLQGIPCIYYGTEQGLSGSGDRREFAREALWGQQQPFDTQAALYQRIRDLSRLRDDHPALRYGRQYHREVSGDGANFGYSAFPGGVIAYSRILNDREIVVVANTSTTVAQDLHVVVDKALNPAGSLWSVLSSTHATPIAPEPTADRGARHTVRVQLAPLEAQVLGREA